jgi:RND family efflux transporter MFP subunit
MPRLLIALFCLLPALAFAAATPVRWQPLAELLQAQTVSVPASVVASQQAQISAQISARVLQLDGQPGDRVAAGDLLVQLDCRDAEHNLTAARASRAALLARRELAEQQLARAKRLRAVKSGTEELVDQRSAELRAARADIEAQQAGIALAELVVSRCQIRAPFAAAITARHAGVGSIAVPGQPLLSLTSLEQSEVSAQIPVDFAAEFRALDPIDAELRFEFSGGSTPLRLRQLSPLADSATRSRSARLLARDVALPGPGHGGRLRWRGAPQLPASLISRRDGQLGVLIADGEQARFHLLPQALEGQPARVDLPGDTLIVTDGRLGLSDGDAIRAADAAANN